MIGFIYFFLNSQWSIKFFFFIFRWLEQQWKRVSLAADKVRLARHESVWCWETGRDWERRQQTTHCDTHRYSRIKLTGFFFFFAINESSGFLSALLQKFKKDILLGRNHTVENNIQNIVNYYVHEFNQQETNG